MQTQMPVRTAPEVAALRATATDIVERGSTDYRMAVARAVLATLDWIDGTAGNPASGDPLVADDVGIVREQMRAEDLERALMRAFADGTWPGTVGQTLAWYRCGAFTESPLL